MRWPTTTAPEERITVQVIRQAAVRLVGQLDPAWACWFSWKIAWPFDDEAIVIYPESCGQRIFNSETSNDVGCRRLFSLSRINAFVILTPLR